MNLPEIIQWAGIIGCGGAGFPTHLKLNKSYEYLIINAAECEPMLRNDRYLMCNKPDEIVSTVAEIKHALGISNAVIALKDHYLEEIEALRGAIDRLGVDVEICAMDTFYPAGDEQAMVYEVTGRVVPPAGLPAMVGCVVDNVATIYAIYEAMNGIPFTHKFLTVTGEVNNPTILYVPIGMPFTECIELAGGTTIDDYVIISGGPMMGKFVPDVNNAFVTKTTSGILVLPATGKHAAVNDLNVENMLNRAKSACIQCQACSDLCPRHMLGHPLRPHIIMRKMATGMDVRELMEDEDVKQALICCECGICEFFACPMGLNPRKINQLLKAEYGKQGIRYQRPEGAVYEAHPMREYRKAPTDKIAGRIGVYKYNHYEIKNCISAETGFVCIPLRQGIGPAPIPCVNVGDSVECGTLIAAPKEGAMGGNVHASIQGIVVEVTDQRICISNR